MEWANEQYKGTLSHVLSTMLLTGLQGLNLYWLFLIGRVAWKSIRGGELEDERSDGEEEDDEVEEMVSEAVGTAVELEEKVVGAVKRKIAS